MVSNEERRRQERDEDVRYGQRLNFMVKSMQRKDAERQQKQKEMHFQMMTQQWDEMIKNKKEMKGFVLPLIRMKYFQAMLLC